MPRDPDATPVEGIGNLRLLADRTSGSEDETQVSCPRCGGKGHAEFRRESVSGYSITRAECWLCNASGMVTARVAVEWSRINTQPRT